MRQAARPASESATDLIWSHLEQVRRAGEQEPPPTSGPILVDQCLDGEEEFRLSLDLVQGESGVTLEQVLRRSREWVMIHHAVAGCHPRYST